MLVRTCDTEGFKALEKDSRGRNQGPIISLLRKLDPDGVHIASLEFEHNSKELRMLWMVKTIGRNFPIQVMMDNSSEAIKKHTKWQNIIDL